MSSFFLLTYWLMSNYSSHKMYPTHRKVIFFFCACYCLRIALCPIRFTWGIRNMHRKYNGVFPTHQGQFRNTEKLEAESIIWTTGLVLVVVNGDYQKKKSRCKWLIINYPWIHKFFWQASELVNSEGKHTCLNPLLF